MTSRRNRRDDEGFSWPPTQDDLDALNVLRFDDRAGAVPANWRVPRQRRDSDQPSVDAPNLALPEPPTIVPSSTSIANGPPQKAPPDPRRAWRAVPLDRLALLTAGVVIGLVLAIVVGLRQPSTAVAVQSPAATPAADGSVEPPATIVEARRVSGPDTTVAAPVPPLPLPAPASDGVPPRVVGLAATPPSGPRPSPPSSSVRDAAPRRALVMPSAGTRASAPLVQGTVTTPNAPATAERAAALGSPDTTAPADMLEVVPGAALGGVSATMRVAADEPTPPPAVPSPASSARPLIVDVLLRYQAAYSRMDVGATRAVWPSVDGRALERAFGTLQQQDLALGACDIAIDQDRATAVCPGTLRYRPRVGNTGPQRRNGRWEIDLVLGARGWAIAGVNVR